MPDDKRPQQLVNAILLVDAATFIFMMGSIYLLVYVLVPKFLFRSRFIVFAIFFVLIIIATFLVVYALDYFIARPADVLAGNTRSPHIEFTLMHFVQISLVCTVLLGAVIGLVIFKKWILDIQRINELQQMNLKTELEQLKSQVNPHFLFNTLNNIMVLTKTNTEKASQVLLGLSDLLRYQLYDSAREKILLSKDIDFIHNLLSLEKIRKEDFVYEISTEGRTDGITLPPFLFIPFVENAIKHGANADGYACLKLHFSVTGDMLHFRSENSKPKKMLLQPGGLGLKNISRRLELLYPGNHSLTLADSADIYVVNLSIPLL